MLSLRSGKGFPTKEDFAVWGAAWDTREVVAEEDTGRLRGSNTTIWLDAGLEN